MVISSQCEWHKLETGSRVLFYGTTNREILHYEEAFSESGIYDSADDWESGLDGDVSSELDLGLDFERTPSPADLSTSRSGWNFDVTILVSVLTFLCISLI